MSDSTDDLIKQVEQEIESNRFANEICEYLITALNKWEAVAPSFNTKVEIQLMKDYIRFYEEGLSIKRPRRYVSPSSISKCRRELQLKDSGVRDDKAHTLRKRIKVTPRPYQGRWAKIGTKIGDMIQETLLAMELDYERLTGETLRVRFERTENNLPMFEEFAQSSYPVSDDIALFGSPDGIMIYTDTKGIEHRFGLEVKSKQTTPAKTSAFSMRTADESHINQTKAYALMYGLEHYVILYVNAAKKSWMLDTDEQKKNPDLRAFYVHIDEEEKQKVIDEVLSIRDDLNSYEYAPIDITNWTMNNYKIATAQTATEEDIKYILEYGERMENSNLPKWKLSQIREAINDFMQYREWLKDA